MWMEGWWLEERATVETVSTWSVVVVIVGVIIATIVVVVIAPVEHALALLEVVCNMINSLLSRRESVATESALSWELCLRVYYARLFVLIRVNVGVDVSEVLHEMILPVAWLDVLHAFTDA